MLRRIKLIEPRQDFCLFVVFDDDAKILYDVKDDFNLPEYNMLKEVTGLFEQVKVDTSRTCVYWNEYIDLPSDIIYEYGKRC